MSLKEDKLEELEKNAVELVKKRKVLFEILNKFKDERDRFNEESRKLRNEALKHRDERNKINESIKEIKKALGPLFETLEEKRGLINQTNQIFWEENRSLPRKSKIETDLKRIEWEMMTTPTIEIKDREDELISRAIELRKILDNLKKIDKQKDKRLDILAETKAVEIEIRSFREKIRVLSKESQEHHEKMIYYFELADKERENANNAHAEFVETLKKINEIKTKLDVVMPQIKEIKNDLRTNNLKNIYQRNLDAKERIESMREKAIIKMKRGDKLSLEDLRLIYGEEEKK
jgi:uncharacterized coiled-coil DUF342 family protein